MPNFTDDIVTAADSASNLATRSHKVHAALLDIGEQMLPAAKFLKKVPFLGSIVTAGFVVHEVGGHVINGRYKLATGAMAVGAVETVTATAGFGISDIARESARALLVSGGEIADIDLSQVQRLDAVELMEVAGLNIPDIATTHSPSLSSQFSAHQSIASETKQEPQSALMAAFFANTTSPSSHPMNEKTSPPMTEKTKTEPTIQALFAVS